MYLYINKCQQSQILLSQLMLTFMLTRWFVETNVSLYQQTVNKADFCRVKNLVHIHVDALNCRLQCNVISITLQQCWILLNQESWCWKFVDIKWHSSLPIDVSTLNILCQRKFWVIEKPRHSTFNINTFVGSTTFPELQLSTFYMQNQRTCWVNNFSWASTINILHSTSTHLLGQQLFLRFNNQHSTNNINTFVGCWLC